VPLSLRTSMVRVVVIVVVLRERTLHTRCQCALLRTFGALQGSKDSSASACRAPVARRVSANQPQLHAAEWPVVVHEEITGVAASSRRGARRRRTALQLRRGCGRRGAERRAAGVARNGMPGA
jgi:hypothetical protein